MKENKHRRILYAIAGIVSFIFYINPIIIGIMVFANNFVMNYNKVALFICMFISIFGIPLSIYIISLMRSGVSEFKKRKPLLYSIMILNIASPIPYVIALKGSLMSFLFSILLILLCLCYYYEIKLNDKFYEGQMIAQKTQIEQMKNFAFKEKEIENNMKTEENEIAFGKTNSPSSPESKKAQQLQEITILYETGLMDINEYRRLKDKILNQK